jgi:hypothetical protein
VIALSIKVEQRGDFARLAARIDAAIARGLNEGGDKVRTRVQRGLKEQTGVKAYRSITSRMRSTRAFAEGSRIAGSSGPAMTYAIIATGKGIPIAEFPVTVTLKGVDAKTWGVDHLFKRSFREKDTGKLRARLGKSRFPIRALYGPSLPKELGQGDIPAIFYAAVAEFVPGAVAKQVARALG